MKTAYIFHDAFCDQFSDWYPWMKSTLEAQGYLVVLPSFPTPAGQSYPSWKAVIKNYLDKFDGETIFIGHGTGGIFALKLLQEITTPINGLFLVASYAKLLGHVGYDRVNETFLNEAFSWGTIKSRTRMIQIFSGQDDPFVPAAISQDLADQLGQELHVIPQGGHLNKASGFTQIIPLAQSVQEMAGKLDKTIEVETPVAVPAPEPSPALQAPSPTHPAGFAERPSLIERAGSVETLAPIIESNLLPLGEGGRRPDEGAHTMYQDMSQLVNSNQGSVASSLLTKARTDAAVKKVSAPLAPKNIFYIIGTIIVVLLAVGIVAFILNRNLPANKQQAVATPTSLILAEKHIKIDTAGVEAYALNTKIREGMTSASSEGITDLYYINGAVRASFASVLSKIGITTLPETLLAELLMPQAPNVPLFMHGVGSLEGNNVHFLVLPVSHYDNAFVGMHEWEPTIVRDLGIFMGMSDAVIKSRSSADVFADETINNRNVRVLRDADHQPTLAYFFLTEHMVVITDHIEGIPEILKRFANSQIYK